MKIFTETVGKGKDVVLMHGWSQDHRSMFPIKEMLQDAYRVTSIDLPGAGQSEWSDDIKTMHDVADILAPYIPNESIYIGWSWGGVAGIALTARYPKKVSHYMGIGTGPRFVEDTDWPGSPKPGFGPAFANINSEQDFRAMLVDGFYNAEFGENKKNNKIYQRLVEDVDTYGMALSTDVLKKGVQIIDAADLREEFKTIKCSIDFIVGTKDPAVLWDWEKVKPLNPRTKVHFIEDAQHMPMHTHTEKFEQILKNILKN